MVEFIDNLGVGEDFQRYFLCLMLAFPVAFVQRKLHALIPAPSDVMQTIKHIYSGAFGLAFLFFCFGTETYQALALAAACYTAMVVLPRKLSYKVVAVSAFGFLCVSHIYRMYADYMGWHLDISGPMMIIVLKVISCAFNYVDGDRNKEDLTEAQYNYRISEIPSPIEYFGYVFFYATILTGPTFEFTAYTRFIKMYDEKSLPSPGRALAVKLTWMLISFIGYFVGMKFPADLYFSEGVLNSSLLHKIVIMNVLMVISRFKYYLAWYIAESVSILSGFGFSGYSKDGASQWDEVLQSRTWQLETGTCVRDVATNWNIRTSHWLKNYVYTRIGKKPTLMSTLCTFLVSAFWHGFYPGYYFCFFTAAIAEFLSKEMRRKIRPLLLGSEERIKTLTWQKFLYNLAGFCLTMTVANSCGLLMQSLSLEKAIIYGNSVYWSFVLGLVVCFSLLQVLPSSRRPEAKKND